MEDMVLEVAASPKSLLKHYSPPYIDRIWHLAYYNKCLYK